MAGKGEPVQSSTKAKKPAGKKSSAAAQRETASGSSNVELHFVGNETIQLEVDLEEWARGFEEAAHKNKIMSVREQMDGSTLAINPRLVTHWTYRP